MTFKRSILLALVLGGLGLGLRWMIWASAYDTQTRLILRPQLLAMFNLFFCLCGAVVALLFLLRWPREVQADAPFISDSIPPVLLRWASVVCYAGAGALLLAQLYTAVQFSKVLLADGIFQLLQVPFLVLLIRRQDGESLSYATLTLFPAFVNCCLVVGLYHQVGAEPNPQVYLWAIAAELLSAAAWVSYAGFGFQYQSGRRFGLLAHLALLTLPVGIIAPLPISWRLTLLAQLLWLLAALLCLRTGAQRPRRRHDRHRRHRASASAPESSPQEPEEDAPMEAEPVEYVPRSSSAVQQDHPVIVAIDDTPGDAPPPPPPHVPRRLRRREEDGSF